MEILGVHLGSGLDPAAERDLLAAVSPAKRERIGRFLRKEDAVRTLLGDVLARLLLGETLGVRNDAIEFDFNAFHKPFFRNSQGMDFSISHSGKWVACALGAGGVGLDIEEVRGLDPEIARHCFSREEYADLMAVPEPDRPSLLYELWTLKESYIKAIGKGFWEGLDTFTIKVRGDRIALLDRAPGVEFRMLPAFPGYKAAACALSGFGRIRLTRMTLAELIGRFHRFLAA